MIKRKYKIILILCAVFLVPTMGMFGGTYSGTVIDVDSKKPISGAKVYIEVSGTIPAPAHARGVIVKSFETTSNSNGKFKVGPWLGSPKGIFIFSRRVHVRAEKEGYGPPPINYMFRGKSIYLKKIQ
jgi:hypothetical protein